MTAAFTGPDGSTALVEARGVRLEYDATVLAGVDLDIASGGELVLTGRSGSGKTSLLLVLSGLVPPTAGSIRWPSLSTDPAGRRAEIAMIFQAPSLLAELTALQNVCLPLRLRDMSEGAARDAAHASLDCVGVDAMAEALPGELSGGQQQRVAVARAIAGRPRLILADEPTGALDREHARQVLRALRDRASELEASLVLATHDLDLAAGFRTQAVIEDGAIRYVA